MSKGAQPRRSKSFQNDPVPPSRTSSPQHLTRVNSSSGSRSRKSLDRQSATQTTNAASGSGSGSGASFEKSRAIRMFANSNSKVPSERDGDSQLSHRKSESWRSEQVFGDDEIAEARSLVNVNFLHGPYNFF